MHNMKQEKCKISKDQRCIWKYWKEKLIIMVQYYITDYKRPRIKKAFNLKYKRINPKRSGLEQSWIIKFGGISDIYLNNVKMGRY